MRLKLTFPVLDDAEASCWETADVHHSHAAYRAHAERFAHGPPKPLRLTAALYISRPVPEQAGAHAQLCNGNGAKNERPRPH